LKRRDLDLEATPVDTGPLESGAMSCYRQGNLAISRKKLQPILSDYLAEQ